MGIYIKRAEIAPCAGLTIGVTSSLPPIVMLEISFVDLNHSSVKSKPPVGNSLSNLKSFIVLI